MPFKLPTLAVKSSEDDVEEIKIGDISPSMMAEYAQQRKRNIENEIMEARPSCGYPLDDLRNLCQHLFPISQGHSRYKDILEWSKQKVLGRGAFGVALLVPFKGRHGNVVVKQINLLSQKLDANALLKEFLFATYAGELGVGPRVYSAWVGSCSNPELEADDDPCFFMVMETVKGKSLKDLKRCPTRFEWEMLLDTIQRLHDNDIVHGDLYARNVIFELNSKDQTVGIKLIDYGLAKFDRSKTAKMSELITSDLNQYCSKTIG